MFRLPVVAYYRVSTARQGRSGLGLEAQKIAVTEFLKAANCVPVVEFVEVESGRKKDRPQLLAALNLCRKHKGTLVIAKLDRLARNVAFISALLESRVKFIAIDMPEADTAFLQIAAVFSEWEARKTSDRTKAALAAAKRRGKLLGWAMPTRLAEQAAASAKGANTNKVIARDHASNVAPVIRSIMETGVCTLTEIAAALNARGVPTARGGHWYPTTVKNILRTAEDAAVI